MDAMRPQDTRRIDLQDTRCLGATDAGEGAGLLLFSLLCVIEQSEGR